MAYNINAISENIQEIITDNGSVVRVHLNHGEVTKATTNTNIPVNDLLCAEAVLVNVFHVNANSMNLSVHGESATIGVA
jgi:hypothetical protein